MKLFRYHCNDQIIPLLLTKDLKIFNLKDYINDINPENIGKLKKLISNKEISNLPVFEKTFNQLEQDKILNYIVNPGKIIAAGANYEKHTRRLGFPKLDKPFFFLKATSSLTGPYNPIIISQGAGQVDYENELAVIIGRAASHIDPKDWEKYVFGYAIANDVSARDWQFYKYNQITMGKSADFFCPIGPFLELNVDHGFNPQDLHLQTWVNGELRQDNSTKTVMFEIDKLISFLSQFFTLYAGDIILTGTPEGTVIDRNVARTKTKFLPPGDQVRMGIDGLGEQFKTVISTADLQNKS